MLYRPDMPLEMVSVAQGAVTALILARMLTQWWLDHLNRNHLRSTAGSLPPDLQGIIDQPTFGKSVEYSLAKSALSRVNILYHTIILLLLLFSGVLPWAFQRWEAAFGLSTFSMAVLLFTIGTVLSITGLPIDWYAQFRLEERFGFNNTTHRLWWADRLKGFVLAVILGLPLIWLVLFLFRSGGPLWWLWAWAALMVVQLLVSVLAPVLILPLFNKLTPLPEGSLRDRLLSLAERTRFRAQSIQIMDGSKRSQHSNAFFTGFGRFRRIVLFDTLVNQLDEPQLEAVLAHEIGHFKRRHIPKMLLASAGGSLLGFFLLSLLVKQAWFYQAFGLSPSDPAAALLLFTLLSGVLTFWLSPVLHAWSRRYEYQADAFAANVMGGHAELSGALRRLTEKNLSNLTPHPVYSSFYYSHPTLLEREHALQRATS